ncbi:hypothetical protein OG788_27570 [Streptomyces sp. NBC_00647]|uniref:hypothetical protein n=1 Tax=Streptomyces sp. NBC_00647 TaxID=2975796 RepID=UPI00324B8EB9
MPAHPARRTVAEPGSASYPTPLGGALHSVIGVSGAADAPSATAVTDLTAFH